MGLSIKNEETVRLVRELARRKANLNFGDCMS